MRIARGARTVGYSLMAATGTAAIIWPVPAVRDATSPAAAGGLMYVWAGMMIVGGVSSALGAATDRWIGEYVGLYPLMATFTVFGLAAFASSRGPAAYASGLCLLGIVALLAGRLRDTDLVRQEAHRQARNDGS